MTTINDIIDFFSKNEIPKTGLKISNCQYIVDQKSMYDSHILYCLNNPKNRAYLPYYERLLFLYNHYNKD